MTPSICAIALGLIALYLWVVNHAYSRALKSQHEVLAAQAVVMDAAGKAHEVAVAHLTASGRKLQIIADALPLHRVAAARGDARGCNAILFAAVQQANAVEVEVKP